MSRSTLALILLVVSLAACEQRDPLFCGTHMDDPRCSSGGDDGDGGVPPGYYVISGNVTGLTGSGLVLLNNGMDDKQIFGTGSFAFSMPVMMGTAYAVTVGTQPTNPSETCTVTNGSGTANNDVGDVTVTCVPTTYTVGGTVVGYTSGTLTLTNNGVDDKSITASGPFTFTTALASGAMYNVAVKTATGAAAPCTAFATTGTVGSGPVTTVVINCSATLFTVGGMAPTNGVSGLNGNVRLTNNGADQITVTSNGSFAFPTLLMTGANYNVAVSQQPLYPPAAQNCVVSNGTGTVNGNVVTVKVVCTTRAFSVGGTVSGLAGGGTVVLKNGADTVSVNANGMFTFSTTVTSGNTYAVTVMTQPAGLRCTVASGSGTMANGNVTNVNVTCADPGTKCGNGYCGAGQECCSPGSNPSCIPAGGSCNGVRMECDDKADCSNKLCCAQRHNGNQALEAITCESQCSNVNNPIQLCNPLVANECANGSCQAWSQLSGYFACQ